MSEQDSKTINSFDEAIAVIENQKEGIPFEAIRYLRDQPTSEKLMGEIIFALQHAYDDTYYDEEEDTTDYSVLPGYDPRFTDRTFPKGYPEASKLKLLKIIAEEAEEERLELKNGSAQQQGQ